MLSNSAIDLLRLSSIRQVDDQLFQTYHRIGVVRSSRRRGVKPIYFQQQVIRSWAIYSTHLLYCRARTSGPVVTNRV